MTRAVKLRIVVFVVLSAVGITYVAASYLGIVDRILGRGITVTATLPSSGGLFEGSEVTYRGVTIGEVKEMSATREGIELTLSLEDGTRLPADAPMYVHNLSAVGEQYLDFEPAGDEGPYAADGDTLTGTRRSLPVDEGDLLVDLDDFVDSVDKSSLQVLVRELGRAFQDTGGPLQQLIDDGGRFVDRAADSTNDTIRLINDGRTVLRTQQAEGENIRSFAADLADLTAALRRSDGDLRRTLEETPGMAVEVRKLLQGLEPTLPILLSDLTTVNQVAVSHISGLEQLLVAFPRTIAGGFTGTDDEGFGHVNLQFDSSVTPCRQGYKPVAEWRRPDLTDDAPIYPARCTAGAPYVQRGFPNVPGTANNHSRPAPPRSFVTSRDDATGVVAGVTDAQGRPVRLEDSGDLAVLGDDSWKWLVVGPVGGP